VHARQAKTEQQLSAALILEPCNLDENALAVMIIRISKW